MATSSITKNFVISGKEQVEMFVNAIEESIPFFIIEIKTLPFDKNFRIRILTEKELFSFKDTNYYFMLPKSNQ